MPDRRHFLATATTIGAKISGAPGNFAYDGKDLVGTRTSFLSDGGAGPLEVVRVPLEGDGGVTTLAVNPFTDNSGFVGGVEVWVFGGEWEAGGVVAFAEAEGVSAGGVEPGAVAGSG